MVKYLLVARLAGLSLLLVLCLFIERRAHPRPLPAALSFSLVPPAQAVGLPAGLSYSPRPHLWVSLPSARDTSRAGAANLQRKALPRCRWQGGYLLYPLPRRPKQAYLDSVAAAARRPAS